jgi:hypothetical protein
MAIKSLEDMTPEQQTQAAQLFQFVKANPDIEKSLRREAKKKNPNMAAPDIELEQALENQKKEFEEKLAAERKERLDGLQAERRREAHDKIKAAGLDPEKVEKVMVDENIGNYDTAINYLSAQAKLAPGTSRSFTPHTMPDTKELWADRNKFAKTQAFQAINEVIAGRKAG